MELQNGTKIRYWEDVWCRELHCLKLSLLFTLADSKRAKAAEVWVIPENQGAWDLRFVWPFIDWEFEMVQTFISLVNSRRITPQVLR